MITIWKTESNHKKGRGKEMNCKCGRGFSTQCNIKKHIIKMHCKNGPEMIYLQKNISSKYN